MKKLLLLSALFIFACSDDEGNSCVYEPTLTTEAATDITKTSATLNGVISVVSENCEVAPGEMQGFVYSTNPSPTNDDNIEVIYGTNISTTIESLEPNTTYYVRAFLTNTIGEFYGNEVDFTTNEEIPLVNCDGAPYPSIVYGTQEWTVENACHITYTDGTPIPQVTDDAEWYYLTTGAWAYYNNDPTKPRLYNWYAIMGIHDTDQNTPNKEFAPEGWHVPGSEWGDLERYLIANGHNNNGTTTENKIGKSMASITGWNSSTNTGAIGNDQGLNNSSGFNALPVGYRSDIGWFIREGEGAIFWSSTPYYTTYAWYLDLGSASSEPSWFKNSMKQGLSVRFVRD